MDLFTASTTEISGPLADRLRPKDLSEFIGQNRVIGPGSYLRKLIQSQSMPPNLIFWGPPGTGKTTLAHLLAQKISADFVVVNAVDTGAKKLREIGQTAHHKKLQLGQRTLLFVDEIHRLNKAQQDVLLPFAEKGDFSLIGATTENPSYELNSALMSRCQLIVFEAFEEKDLKDLFSRACRSEGVEPAELLDESALQPLLTSVGGDGRRLLNDLEQLITDYKVDDDKSGWPLGEESLVERLREKPLVYDRTGDEHYNCISAFIKSVRGSDPDASVYYLARMLEGGEDPVFIARRLVVLASEDIGNADPRALTLCISALQAVELIGMPEARICLSQATTYLACAPKSNRSYRAIGAAQEYVRKTGALSVPKALRSAKTKLMKSIGYGKGYKYSHDGEKGYLAQEFLPEKARGKKFYEPSDHGFEKTLKEYLKWLRN